MMDDDEQEMFDGVEGAGVIVKGILFTDEGKEMLTDAYDRYREVDGSPSEEGFSQSVRPLVHQMLENGQAFNISFSLN